MSDKPKTQDKEFFESITEMAVIEGGPGSGHTGHAGRSGDRGGSLAGQPRGTLTRSDYVDSFKSHATKDDEVVLRGVFPLDPEEKQEGDNDKETEEDDKEPTIDK